MTTGNPDELACQELVELATEYLSDAMSVADRARFDRHLGTCDLCIAYLAQLKQTVELAGGLAGGGLSSEAERDLLALFRQWKQK